MNAGPPNYGRSTPYGFTLIELLLSLAATSVILGAAYAALFSGLSGFQYSSQKTEALTILQRALDRMTHNLSCLYISDSSQLFRVSDDIRDLGPLGEIPNDSLLFLAFANYLTWEERPQSDLAELEYLIDVDEETPAKWLIQRMDSPVDEDRESGGVIRLVGPRVIGMDIHLYNGSEWVEEWGSRDGLPSIVNITLYMQMADDQISKKRIETLSANVWLPEQDSRHNSGTGEGEPSGASG